MSLVNDHYKLCLPFEWVYLFEETEREILY